MGDDPFGYRIGTHCEAGVSSGCRDGYSAGGEAFERSARASWPSFAVLGQSLDALVQ
jgi:hypothetical protein